MSTQGIHTQTTASATPIKMKAIAKSAMANIEAHQRDQQEAITYRAAHGAPTNRVNIAA